MTFLDIEENLKLFLQKNIQIKIGEKVLREGKLILFNLKDYYLTFIMKVKGRNKVYEIPYPFANKLVSKDCLELDYQLTHIHNNEPALLKHNVFCTPKKSKLYNSVVRITA